MMMAVQHALVFAVMVCACLFATSRWRTEPVLALVMAAVCFGAAAGCSLAQLGKSFGAGFGAMAASVGLAVFAAAFVATIASPDGALRRPIVVSAAGLVAGMGASPAGAFAVLARPCRGRGVRLGLAISAGQGLLLPSPVTIAAATILGADWRSVAAIGVPCALLVTLGAGLAVRRREIFASAEAAPIPAGVNIALGLASLAMTALMIVQSLGDIPDEPFGGGGAREFLLGLGRPLILLLAGGAIVLGGSRASLLRELSVHGAAGVAVARAAPLVLLVGCAGGLQSLAIDAHMADTIAETISAWHASLLAPFLAACCLKLLQGSSLVAAITAAGLMLPALSGLGLDTETGRACAALAVGAGAVAGSHINDGLFWLVAHEARLHPSRGCAWFTVGTLLQGIGAVGFLMVVVAACSFG